jgi:hypothetical protein
VMFYGIAALELVPGVLRLSRSLGF